MQSKTPVRQMVLTAMFAALTAVLAQIQIPIGPIPFNLAVFGAYLTGMLLSPSWAIASMGVYMMLGVLGIPVFAGFQGGPAALFGKTGGYVIGYLFITGLTALAQKHTRSVWFTALAMLAGLGICYTFGTAWFMVVTHADLPSALALCVVPFVLPDLGKAVCALLLGKVLKRRLTTAHAF